MGSDGTVDTTTDRPKSGKSPWRRPVGLTWRQRDAASGYGFIAPQFIGFTVFVLGPIAAVIWFSLHEWNLVVGNFDFVGLGNYSTMLSDPEVGHVALISLAFAFAYVPLNVGLGLLLAIAANRAIRSIGILRTLYFAPVVVSLVAWTIVFRFILQDEGVLNGLLRLAGVDGPNWLREATPALTMVIVVQVLKTAGLSMVIFLAALQGIPREVSEAARVDGASGWAVFRRITVPLISPFIFLVVVLSVINSIKSFALIQLLTDGGPGRATTVLAYYIYDQGFQRLEMGYASTIAVVLFVVVLTLTALQFGFRKRWVYSEE